jgi:hypothetical protein
MNTYLLTKGDDPQCGRGQKVKLFVAMERFCHKEYSCEMSRPFTLGGSSQLTHYIIDCCCSFALLDVTVRKYILCCVTLHKYTCDVKHLLLTSMLKTRFHCPDSVSWKQWNAHCEFNKSWFDLPRVITEKHSR